MPRNGAVLTRYDSHCMICVSGTGKSLKVTVKLVSLQAVTLPRFRKHTRASTDGCQTVFNCVMAWYT